MSSDYHNDSNQDAGEYYDPWPFGLLDPDAPWIPALRPYSVAEQASLSRRPYDLPPALTWEQASFQNLHGATGSLQNSLGPTEYRTWDNQGFQISDPNHTSDQNFFSPPATAGMNGGMNGEMNGEMNGGMNGIGGWVNENSAAANAILHSEPQMPQPIRADKEK